MINMNLHSDDIKTKQVVGEIRQTQMITTFGCGSIVDLPNASVIIAGTDFWQHYKEEKYIIQEVNLQKLLNVNFFVKPKSRDNVPGHAYVKSRDIPAFRFPETLICANENCGKIGNYKLFKRGKRLICPLCGNRNIIPSRFVVACTKGHVEDFPYDWWVHKDSTECENPDLRLFYRKETGGLDSIVIWCKNCKQSKSMKYSFTPNSLKGYPCGGNRPWLRDKDKIVCTEPLKTIQRGSSAIYYSNHVSALSIPPWSDAIQKELNKHDNALRKLNIEDENILELFISFTGIVDKLKCSKEELKRQIIYRLNNYRDPEPKKDIDIRLDEYNAFCRGDSNSVDFVIEPEKVPESLGEYIDQIVLAKRIKEILVLTGFRRIQPVDEFDDAKDKIAPLSKNRKDWLPAVEFWGEGIFIKFNRKKLRQWETREDVEKRVDVLKSNMVRANYYCNKCSPRFVLLHTFAHLLIRQITLQCGYSTSALKERIYTTETDGDNLYEMEGIFIYTASPDSEGSLGGLVSQGRSSNIENTIIKTLDKSRWCSSDPLCVQSGGQGLNSLNLAACHSCALLPETSCEMRNLFLDRATLIGTLENKNIGFFNF
ncbi:DUF1998 domain-containing protein [Clostridium sp. Cult3]|uniref:DUF1998 domain-containing protein n=1 Tax=Clostridium sp. Cult3 TaxID=2079004 RepID=UPI001F1FA86C|nr:DUF1998 domain-containing protein [Clostridium sp. Cult3]